MIYAQKITYRPDGKALLEMVSSDIPQKFPLITDDVKGVGSGRDIAPGSSILITSTSDTYVLGCDDALYYKQDRCSGGTVIIDDGDDNTASSEEVQSIIDSVFNDTDTGGEESACTSDDDNTATPEEVQAIIDSVW